MIRLLIANRRNFPIALIRKTFKEKGKLFSEFGVQMRSVRDNHTAVMMTLHYLESGTMHIAIQVRKKILKLKSNMENVVSTRDILHSSYVHHQVYHY